MSGALGARVRVDVCVTLAVVVPVDISKTFCRNGIIDIVDLRGYLVPPTYVAHTALCCVCMRVHVTHGRILPNISKNPYNVL